ncbi:MAG: cytochrome c1 [Pseudomonadota bacterium]
MTIRLQKPLRRAAAAIAALALGVGLSLSAGVQSAEAAGKGVAAKEHDFVFEGVFGSFDRGQLRRGWQVYAEVCKSCHALEHLSYRNLGEPGGPEFSPEDVKAIASTFEVPDIDEFGDEIAREALPSDKMALPYPNEIAARSANAGAYPPDLSLITKARTGCTGIWNQIWQGGACGPEYVYSLLLGYTDVPEGFDPGDLSYNKYFPGHKIAMAQPLYEEQVEYLDGTEATLEQQAEDVTAFLHWAAEPKLEERKEAGFRNIVFLTLFAILLYFSNRKLWASVKGKE